MTDIRWLEDHVPNFLWAAGLVVGDADRGLFRIARVVDAISEICAEEGLDLGTTLLDGTLTSFEAISERIRPAVVEGLRSRGLETLVASQGFVHAIRMYPGAPGSWLADVATSSDPHVDPEQAETYLAGAIAAIANGSGVGGTAMKATTFRQMLTTGRLRFDSNSVPADALKRYPKDVTSGERGLVESFLRASFGSFVAARDDSAEERVAWAKRFWTANWSLYPCRVRDPDAASPDEIEPSKGDEPPEVSDFGERITDVWVRFLEDAHHGDPGLYDPGRHEVVSGLTAHGLRITFVVAASPALWVGEFSAPLLRSVVEILIVLAWLGTAEGREPGVPERFKEFGRGRLKLAKLHAEEFADKVSTNVILEEVLEGLDEEVNREIDEEFQDISLEATFTGRDLRKMAIGAGADWSYKLELAPMSSVLHSEWPILTRYAMELCVTPLHRFHWLPRTTLAPAVRPVAGETAVILAQRLLDAYLALVVPTNAPESPAKENRTRGDRT